MVGTSVILPHAGAPAPTLAFARSLLATLAEPGNPVEVLVVALHDSRQELAGLRDQSRADEPISVWRLAAARGADAAVWAALERCRYETVIAIDPSAGYSALDAPRLLERLARHDLVITRRRLRGWQSLLDRARRSLGLLRAALPPITELCWAARREALPNTNLPLGALRRLPSLVARRGYRVGEIYVSRQPGQPGASRTRQRLPDVWAAWWLAGREHRAHCESAQEALSATQWRFDSAQSIRPSGQGSRRGAHLDTYEQR